VTTTAAHTAVLLRRRCLAYLRSHGARHETRDVRVCGDDRTRRLALLNFVKAFLALLLGWGQAAQLAELLRGDAVGLGLLLLSRAEKIAVSG